MPIINQQRRMRQLGEIRLGHVVATSNGKTRPDKLDKFRFTSPSAEILQGIADAYGGEVKPWTPANGDPDEFEVYTDAKRLPVVVPPMAVSQWFEMYAGSKCVRRCDTVFEQKSDGPCICNPEARDCTRTTRLNVMMRDVGPIGVWLLTSHGYYAAAELPPVADLLAQGGGNVPGWLGIEARREVHESGTRRFMVPILDIDLTAGQILAGSAPRIEIEGVEPQRQIEAGPAAGAAEVFQTEAAYVALAQQAQSVDALTHILAQAGRAGFDPDGDAPVRQACLARRAALEITDAMANDPRLQGDVPVDPTGAEPDPDAVWQQILKVAGGFEWSLTDTKADFANRNGGLDPDTASGHELKAYLDELTAREPVTA